jgi:hypothetical protein
MWLMPLLLTQMGFFWELRVLLHLSWIGLFDTKWAFLHLENSDLQEYSFQKLTQFSQGNNVLDAAASNIDGCLGGIHVLFKLAE